MPSPNTIPDLSMTIIDKGRLQLLEVIGAGAFGTVYRAHDRECCTFRAVKVMPRIYERDSERGRLIEREYIHHGYVSGHPNIVKFHRITFDSDYVYFVLDYLPGGDLLNIILNKRLARNDEFIKSLLIQLVDAVYACHQNRIYHRDLKPENIFVNGDMSKVFLGDFGLSIMSTKGRSDMFRVGTSNYMSPECHHIKTGGDYNLSRNDIWGIGMIANCLITGCYPWKCASLDDDRFAAYVADRSHLRSIFPISKEADEILRSIFTLREEKCVDLLSLRERLANVKTFYMSDEELAKAHPSVRERYDYYMRVDDIALVEELSSSVYISASGDSLSSDESQSSDETEVNVVLQPVVEEVVVVVQDNQVEGPPSSFVNMAELPAVVQDASPAPPPFDLPAAPERAVSPGTEGSSSSSEDTEPSSVEDSDLPITPETHAQDPELAILEMSSDAGLGEQAVKFEIQPFEKARSPTAPQSRLPSRMLDTVGRVHGAA